MSVREGLQREIRQGVRALRRRPGFTATAVVTLAIGVGANAALFSLVRGILLQPLPYPQAEQLVEIHETNAAVGGRYEETASGNIQDWRRRTGSFEGIAGSFVMGRTLRVGEDAIVVRAAQVSEDFFHVAGTSPRLGRTFTAEETARSVLSRAAAPIGEDPVAILGHRLWAGRFGADPTIVGRQVSIERRSFTVVGVMPPEFALPDAGVDVWIPWSFVGDRPRDQRYVTAVARLRPGVTLAAAQSEMDAVTAALAEEHPDTNRGWAARLVPLHEEQVGAARTALLVLFGAVGLVLLIACANVASLQLARGQDRRREIAVRLALGASRLRLLEQLLVENLLLALAGGALGAGLGLAGVELLKRLQPGGLPRLQEVSLDPTVLGFTLGLALLVGLVSGLAPALAGTRVDPGTAIQAEAGRGRTAGPGRQRLRSGLVIAEMALAVVLLVGAGLLLRSFARLTAVDPGFDAHHVLILPIFLDQGTYDSGDKVRAYFDGLETELRALPGVREVGGATALPLSPMGPDFSRPAWADGEAAPAPGEGSVDIRMARSGYFRTMGMSILRGRGIGDEDTMETRKVAVINESLARRHWPGRNPVGQRLWIDYAGTYPYEVVGVVNDIRFYGQRARPRPEVYLPHRQKSYLILNMAVKTDVDAEAMIPAVRAAVLRVDPGLPAQSIVPLEELLGASVERDRFALLLLGGFALTAVLLSAIGIFGLLSYVVGQRSFEIGIRIALGADPGRIRRLVLVRGAALACAGLLLGTLVARAATHVLTGMLFEIDPGDPGTFAAVSVLLGAIALAACYGPARRAASVEVTVALRHD